MGRRGPPPIFTDELRVGVRPDTRTALNRLADERGTSVSALVRDALDNFYEEEADSGAKKAATEAHG